MGIAAPLIDDRNYETLLDELLKRIPVYSPEWSDFNDSDLRSRESSTRLISLDRPTPSQTSFHSTGPLVQFGDACAEVVVELVGRDPGEAGRSLQVADEDRA